MKIFSTRSLSLLFLLLAPVFRSAAAAPVELPKFDELYKLVRSNLTSLSAEDLDRAATQGLLNQLPSQVQLVGGVPAAVSLAAIPVLGKAQILDGSFGYFRMGRVDTGLAEKFTAAYSEMTRTNRLKGLVLDLRFSAGTNYSAATDLADGFVSSEQTLLTWGDKTIRSKAKSDAIQMPVAVLVNQQTSGAAEVLAAILRETQSALLIGGATAGQASSFQEFPLENGQRLRVAGAPLKFGDGHTISAQGLKPDILITLPPEDEKAYFEDPFRITTRPVVRTDTSTNGISSTDTNRSRRRLNEAELVRLQREGASPELDVTARSPKELERSLVTDPALARALDLLKGLAVVQQRKAL